MGDLAKAANAYFDMIKQNGGQITPPVSKHYNPAGEYAPTTIYEDISQQNAMQPSPAQVQQQVQQQAQNTQTPPQQPQHVTQNGTVISEVPENWLGYAIKEIHDAQKAKGKQGVMRRTKNGKDSFWISGMSPNKITKKELEALGGMIIQIESGQDGSVWVKLEPTSILSKGILAKMSLKKAGLPS
jgi:hypothetical protein